jgi:choline dehydrogenase
MGPSSDPEAIVDNELRVHGFKKLRVADTSIIPYPITGHTSAPSYLIGERLYDFLKIHWNL